MLNKPNKDYFYFTPTDTSSAVITPTAQPAQTSPAYTHYVKKHLQNF